MATTTNYSWTTPDDTDLVKDGASAIRSLGSAIDTTTKALNPSTTLGDIEYRSSTANTNTRLEIGTEGQVLLVSSGVPAWGTAASGGMTLISTTSLSGVSTTVTSIPTTYKNLQLIFRDLKDTGNATRFRIQFNGNTGSVYDDVLIYTTGSTAAADFYYSTGTRLNWAQPQDQNTDGFYVINVFDYASSNSHKLFTINSGYLSTTNHTEFHNARFRSDSAITSLTIESVNGVSMAGSLLLYGVS